MAKRLRQGPTMIQRSRQTPSEEKALYHNVLGAGTRRVKRPFLGLTDAEANEIGDRLVTFIGQQFAKAR